MEHGLKDIAFYVQKHITPCTVVITSLLIRDKTVGAPASVKVVYYLTSSLTETEPHTAITNQPEESKENIAIEKNVRKVTWNSKILRNNSKDRDSNFVVMFSSSKS